MAITVAVEAAGSQVQTIQVPVVMVTTVTVTMMMMVPTMVVAKVAAQLQVSEAPCISPVTVAWWTVATPLASSLSR